MASQRPAITERQILDAALALLDAGGPAAASIRRVAAAVGVAPTTVYTYFPEWAAVERALVERLLGDVRLRAAGTWRARVEALATELRARLLRHPGAVPILIGGPIRSPSAERLRACLVALLIRAGLAPESADRAAYLLKNFVLGWVALEIADAERSGGAEQYLWGLRKVLDGIEAETKLD
ncbi:TetR/AcrR family transcriptional regulator [Actinoplanes sp. CA-030573]|uniref:TetR/AcrR family transcriptional regulator n=1 Tax=Actinoplanes sp. CA-030573 TaxID=3239898 RepID=UPI003D8B6C9C